jgi:Rieske Fe-S protein
MEIIKGIITSERRDFIKKAGGLTAMAILSGTLLQSCSSEEDTLSLSDDINSGTGIVLSGNVIEINLDLQTILKNSGGWILIPEAKLLVVNDGGIYKALTSVCTHSACDNQWDLSGGDFICNCHGSKFTTDGVVVAGPANRDLKKFTTSVNANVLTVTK